MLKLMSLSGAESEIMPVTGGHNLRRILRKAQTPGGVKHVDVGFYQTSKYETGSSVPGVAAVQEFGSPAKGIPSRPFMRNANSKLKDEVPEMLKRLIDEEDLKVDHALASLIGEKAKSVIQQEITDMQRPPNAPSTVEQKGRDNPLIDTGKMRREVTYKVDA